jgi:molecular chaperone GrpE
MDNQQQEEQDDVTIEPNTNSDTDLDADLDMEYSEEDARAEIKKLKTKIKELQKESAENLLGWQRTKADYVNAQKEAEKSKFELIKYANENLINELLPVLDAFDMAMANKEAWEKVEKNWRSGIEYIYNQMLKVLENAGVMQINPLGEKLDVTKHNPVGVVQIEDKSQVGMIAEVMQKGYTLGGKEIRPAGVKVFE